MNIIFAIVAFSIIISNRGYTEARISKLEPNTPAIESGLQVGDKILAIDGSRVFTTTDVSMGIQLSKGKTVDLLVNRNGKKENIYLENTYQLGYESMYMIAKYGKQKQLGTICINPIELNKETLGDGSLDALLVD